MKKATSVGKTNGSAESSIRQTVHAWDHGNRGTTGTVHAWDHRNRPRVGARDASETFQLEMTLKEYTETARQFTHT